MTVPSDPMAARMIFLRIGWMDRYNGVSGGDSISGGGAYVAEHGFGHEIFNFQDSDGSVYGYVQPSGRKEKWQSTRIDIDRLGAAKQDESLSGLLAVWVATAKAGGAYIVGWYQNATLHRAWQPAPPGSARKHADVDCGYYISAKHADAVLIPADERVFSIPQHGPGNFGQSNIWYADDPDRHRQLRLDVLGYIDTRRIPTLATSDPPIQTDPLLRQKVERAAVDVTVAYFRTLGYVVTSVEKDNVGWDLEATLGKRRLRLEVKGLSGNQTVVELTPNEYVGMTTYHETYRVCVVTNALTAPQLEVFGRSPDSGRWESDTGKILHIEEMVAARCSAT